MAFLFVALVVFQFLMTGAIVVSQKNQTQSLRNTIRTIERRVMASVAESVSALQEAAKQVGDLPAVIDTLKAHVTDFVTGVETQIGDLQTQLEDLKMQGVDTAVLDAITTQLVGAVTGVQASVSNVASAVPAVSTAAASALAAPFVEKVEGETYEQYVARAQAAGFTPIAEADWNALAVGTAG